MVQNAVNDDKSASILKFLGKELERHPENRCVKTEQCVNHVRKGSSVLIYVNICMSFLNFFADFVV